MSDNRNGNQTIYLTDAVARTFTKIMYRDHQAFPSGQMPKTIRGTGSTTQPPPFVLSKHIPKLPCLPLLPWAIARMVARFS